MLRLSEVNVAFFLTPKQDVVWLPATATMRQALERMEFHRYAAVPILDAEGKYVATITEGDLLWMMKHNTSMSFADTERVRIADVPRARVVQPVHVDAQVEALLSLAMEQNFVPVVDDRERFIGIVRRSAIVEHLRARRRAEEGGLSPSVRERWLCIMDGLGVIVGVWGGAPGSWIGRHVDACAGIPSEVRAAAHELLRAQSRGPFEGPVRVARVASTHADIPDFSMLLVEAMVLRPTPVDLTILIPTLLGPLERQAESAGVTLTVNVALNVPECVLDEAKIGWALTSLVGSALRHSRRAGAVSVDAKADGNHLVLSVRDDGAGIPSGIRPYLWDPDPETGRPSGLALRMVQEVAVAHGGGLTVHSSNEPGERGTSVIMRIPMRGATDAVASPS
jgi:CBS domain-containing protein